MPTEAGELLEKLRKEQAGQTIAGLFKPPPVSPELEGAPETSLLPVEEIDPRRAMNTINQINNRFDHRTNTGVGVESGARKFINNFLALPQIAGEMLSFAAGGIQTGLETPFVEGNFGDRFGQNVETQRQQGSLSPLVNLPPPTISDIEAIPDTLAGRGEGSFNQRFIQNSNRRGANFQALEEEFPNATAIGEGAGDVATILTGRAPLVRARAPKLRGRRVAVEKAATEPVQKLPAHIREEIDDIIARSIGPGLKRIGKKTKRFRGKLKDATLEGATVAFLNDANPVEVAAYAAGAQSVGSLGLALLERPVVRGSAAIFATSFVAIRLWNTLTPAEQNVFEDLDFASTAVLDAYALGLAGAAFGAGRRRSFNTERFPVAFDAITAIPRVSLQKIMLELFTEKEEGGDLQAQVLQKLSSDPKFFNHNITRSLGRAMLSDKEGAFEKEIKRLLKESPSFREKMGDI